MFQQRMLWPPGTTKHGIEASSDSASSTKCVDTDMLGQSGQMEREGNSKHSKPHLPLPKSQLSESPKSFNMDDNRCDIYFDPVSFPDCSRLTQALLAEKVTESYGGRTCIKVKEYASKARKRIRFSCGSCSNEEDKCQFTFQINFLSNSSLVTVDNSAAASVVSDTGKWFLKRRKGSFFHTCGLHAGEESLEQLLAADPLHRLLQHGWTVCSKGFLTKRGPEDEEGSTKPLAAPTSSALSSLVPPEETKPKSSSSPTASRPTDIAFIDNRHKRGSVSPLPPPVADTATAASKVFEMAENDGETADARIRSKRKKSEGSPENVSKTARKKRNSPESQANEDGKKTDSIAARTRVGGSTSSPSTWQPTHVLLIDPPRRPSPPPKPEPSQRTSTVPPISLPMMQSATSLSIPPKRSVYPIVATTASSMDVEDEDSPEQVLLSMRESRPQQLPKSKPDDLLLLSFAASCLGDCEGEVEENHSESTTKEATNSISREHSREYQHTSTADEESHDFQDDEGQFDDQDEGELGSESKERVSTSVFWMRRFNELKDFRIGHGHCLVPQTYKQNPALGNWVKNQRAQYKIWQYLQNEDLQDLERPYRKTCSLNLQRIRLLEEIGFQWRVSAMNKVKGRKAPNEISSIKNYNKHEEVKKSRKSKQGKEEKKEPKKTAKKSTIAKAEKEDDDWVDMFSELEEFQVSHGKCPVSRRMFDKSGVNPRLWPWMREQRRQWQQFEAGKPSRLTKERIYMLDCLDFSWDQVASSQAPTMLDKYEDEDAPGWMEKYSELQKYIQGGGALPPPEGSTPLEAWILKQQAQYKLFKEDKESFMTPERIRLLEKLQFPWKEPASVASSSFINIPAESDDWSDMYNDLKDYSVCHGDCLVPFRGRNIKLIDWMAQQRCHYQEGSEARASGRGSERVQLLNAIGFEWDDKEAAWMTNFVELGRYFRRHGAGVFPPRQTHSLLWLWVNEQAMSNFSVTRRLSHRAEGSELTSRRRDLLDLIGFPWDRFAHDQSATH